MFQPFEIQTLAVASQELPNKSVAIAVYDWVEPAETVDLTGLIDKLANFEVSVE